jgi:serine/threonine protein phosphatase 1
MGFIAIGDIHGCIIQLNEILEKTKMFPLHKLVFLGDYIDRGPDSEMVCEKLGKIDGIFLKGNHEEMLLKRVNHDSTKIEQLLSMAKISKSSLNWINTKLKSIFVEDEYIFVHAGLDVAKSLNEQKELDYFWTRWDKDYSQITNKTVIHGHTVITNPEIVGNRININTGCGSGGFLTALVVPEMLFLNSSISLGKENNWDLIRKELENEIEELQVLVDE